MITIWCMTRPDGIPSETEVRTLMERFGSDAAIAAHLGVVRQTVMRWRRRYGLIYARVPAKAA
jgi:hypothetical protein